MIMPSTDDNYQIPDNYAVITNDVIELMRKESRKHNANITKWLSQLSKVEKRHLFVAFAGKNKIDGSKAVFDETKTQLTQIFFGFTDIDNGWMKGVALSEIIFNGQNAKAYLHGPDMKMTILEGFFDKYLDQGVGYLDPEGKKFKVAARYQEKLKTASASDSL